jgi:hypothetical protein
MMPTRKCTRHSMRLILALLIGVSVAISTSAQEKLTDLQPLVGHWAAETKAQSAMTISTELTINEDGTFSRVSYIRVQSRFSQNSTDSVTGTLRLVDGTVHWRNSKGETGTYTLYVNDKGKQTLKWARDGSPYTAEFERK